MYGYVKTTKKGSHPAPAPKGKNSIGILWIHYIAKTTKSETDTFLWTGHTSFGEVLTLHMDMPEQLTWYDTLIVLCKYSRNHFQFYEFHFIPHNNNNPHCNLFPLLKLLEDSDFLLPIGSCKKKPSAKSSVNILGAF